MNSSRASIDVRQVLQTQNAPWVVAIAIVGALLIATQPGFVLVGLGMLAAGAVLLLRWPWLIFIALVASVPVQQLILVPAGGRVLTVTQLAFVGSLAITAVALFSNQNRLRSHLALVPFGLMLFVFLISVAFAADASAALSELARWLVTGAALVFGLIFLGDASRLKMTALVVALGLGGVFQAAFGVVQSVLALGPESFFLNSGVSRAFGTFGMPNSYAGYLEIVLFPVIWLGGYYALRAVRQIRTYRQLRLRRGFYESATGRRDLLVSAALGIALLAMALITLSGIVASLSRGAWLGVAIAFAFTAFLAHSYFRIAMLASAPLILIVVISGASGFAPAPIAERVEDGFEQFRIIDPVNIEVTDDNFATVERLAHWQAGLRMFEDSPVAGVGIGNFNERYDDFYVRQSFDNSRGHAHNYYIHTLAETGVLGLTFYLTFIFGVIAVGVWTVLRSTDPFLRYLALGSVGSMVAVATHNAFDNLHVLNLGIVQAALWAIILVSYRAGNADSGISTNTGAHVRAN